MAISTIDKTHKQELVPSSAKGRSVLAKFFRAAGDPTRLALLAFIADGERNASECVELAGVSQSRVSAHLACLVNCGYLSIRRDGRFTYYSIRDPRVTALVRLAAELAADNAAQVAACAQV
jgi:DNA-binding transcriptional ArsR family regulator